MPETDLVALFVPLSFFFLIGFIVAQSRRRAELGLQRRYELGVRTLDRFSDADALEKFLSSDAGREFLNLLDGGDAPIARRLMRSLQGGIILAFVGVAFLLLAAFVEPELVVPGMILLALGAALLVGTMVSLRLARRWELTGGPRAQRSGAPYREAVG